MMRATLYYLDGVGDIEQVREALASLQVEIPHELLEIDIAGESALEEKYGSRVPVLEVGAYTLNAPFSEIDLRVALGAARDSGDRLDEASDGPPGHPG
ncbi:MAG: glutaredoxin family protein, partial [Anaerolineales bacterium]